jgi:streptomycin 6-kinase
MRAEISTYLTKWQLELEQPFETHSSQLAYVTRGSTRAVLKIPNPGSDEHRGAAILMHWGGPAARVLEHDAHALLIERAIPGTTLAELFEAGKDEEATHIWCDVVEQLHRGPAPEGSPDMVLRGQSLLNPTPHPLLLADLVAEARREYFDLCATQSDRRFLLHADLHHFNILKDEKRGWIVIDPKGYVGELEWETGSLFRNPIGHWDITSKPAIIERRVQILCDRFGFDPVRVLRWCGAQKILSAAWSAEEPGHDAMIEGVLKIYKTTKLLLGQNI